MCSSTDISAAVVLQSTDIEYIITWIMFPVSILLLVIGRFAAKHENNPFMVRFSSPYFSSTNHG